MNTSSGRVIVLLLLIRLYRYNFDVNIEFALILYMDAKVTPRTPRIPQEDTPKKRKFFGSVSITVPRILCMQV